MGKNRTERENSENAVSFAQKLRKDKRLLGAICIIVALLFLAAAFFIGFAVGRDGLDEQERSLLWMVDKVQENYHDEVSRDELFDRMYDALELDRFCSHSTPAEYEKVLDSKGGVNKDYGISLADDSGAVRISRVIQNSPAELAGLRKGMYVFAAGGSASAVTAYLSARESATLTCGFLPDGSDAREFSVQSAKYAAAYCSYADSGATYRFRGEEPALTEAGAGLEGLPSDTAYIALTRFEGRAAEEFAACLSAMKERGRKHLILDLRGNGGGYLSIFCEIAAHLMCDAAGKSPLALQARFRDGRTQNDYAAGNDFSAYFQSDAKIRVLADENTASASEALIGVLISYGTCGYRDIYLRKGTGTAKTYGKGVMQTRFVAPDGNMMMLTTADVYWPNGVCIHGTGVTEEDGAIPVSAPRFPAEQDEFLERVLEQLA